MQPTDHRLLFDYMYNIIRDAHLYTFVNYKNMLSSMWEAIKSNYDRRNNFET
jgi:hypothetical protein